MIGSAEMERAEKTLQVVYGGDLGRQLGALRIEREALDNVLEHCIRVIDRHYTQARRAMDPRLGSAYNTMMVHLFLMGVIAGRNSARVVE